MSLLTKTRSLLPKSTSDSKEKQRVCAPGMFDFNTNLFNFGFTESTPPINVLETSKDFELDLAAPGLERKDFKIEVENSSLNISVDKEEEDNKNIRRREYSYNRFFRSFYLPDNVLSDKIDAHYENGILRVMLPKKETTASKPKKEIPVA